MRSEGSHHRENQRQPTDVSSHGACAASGCARWCQPIKCKSYVDPAASQRSFDIAKTNRNFIFRSLGRVAAGASTALSVVSRTLCGTAHPASCKARTPRRIWVLLPPRSQSSETGDLGGEQLHEVVESLAHSDGILRHSSVDHEATHGTKAKRLGQLMQINLITATPDTKLSDVMERMKRIEGLPVVDDAGKLVGVLSKKDFKKVGTLVKDVMSTQPIALKTTDTASAAGHTMIDHKFHRMPVVDEAGTCVGTVTRTDIFWALANNNDSTKWFRNYGIEV